MRTGEIIDPATEIASLLSWWREAGVDVFIDEQSRDWLAPVVRVPAAPAAATAPIAKTASPQPNRTEDELPATLDAFQSWLATNDGIGLPVASRVAPAGDIASGLMLLVDQPDTGDAEAGQVMTGETGRLFDRMLAAIGRDRASIYLAAMAPARPTGGYVDPDSGRLFARLTRHHVALAKPRLLLLMGEAPSRVLLGKSFVEARGRVHDVDLPGGAIRAIATFHPRTLIQHPAQKARAWADLQLLMKTLEA